VGLLPCGDISISNREAFTSNKNPTSKYEFTDPSRRALSPFKKWILEEDLLPEKYRKP
jgi:hypothetical protein